MKHETLATSEDGGNDDDVRPPETVAGLAGPQELVRGVVVAFAYFGAAVVSNLVSGPLGIWSLVWLPCGVSLAVFLVWGWRAWPGVFLGALMAYLWELRSVGDGGRAIAVFGGAVAGVAGPWLGAFLARRCLQWPTGAWTERGAVCLFLFGGLVGGVCGGLLLALFWIPCGIVPTSAWGYFLVSQTLAQALGAGVLVPLLLLPSRGKLQLRGRQGLRTLVPRIAILVAVLVVMDGVARNVGNESAVGSTITTVPLSFWRVPSAQFAAFALTTLLGVVLMSSMGKTSRVEAGFHAARREAEAAREEMAMFFRASLDMLGVAGMDGYFKRINPAFSETLGYSDEEILSRPFLDFVHPDDVGKTVEAVEKLSGGESVIRFQNRYRDRDGRYLWLEWCSVPDSKRELIFAVARNVTEQKKTEDDLRRSNAELEQFAYVASHDLQEPLRMVTSFAQLLQRRYQGQRGEDADEYIRHMVDGTGRMRRLILGLLELSRVAREGRELTAIDSSVAVKIALKNLKIVIEESAAEIRTGELPMVMGDQDQLVSLFQNLIGNAIKYGRGKGTLVSVDAARVGGEWLFTVADDGLGVAPEHRERVFQIFQRLHSHEKIPGTGIGLSLCRHIVSRHGGEIWIETSPLGGASIRFTLTIAKGGNVNTNWGVTQNNS